MENVGGVDQPRRIVAIFYVVAAIAVGMFLERMLEIAFGAVGINDPPLLGDWTLSTLLGFAVAAAAAIAVIIASFVAAVILGLFDLLWSFVSSHVY